MALANRGVSGWFLFLTVQDVQLDTVTKTYELQATSAAEATASRDAIIAEWGNVSGAEIITASMSFIQDEAAPTGGAGDNSIKARISWLLNGGGKATQDIPAPLEAIFVATTGPNNNIVDGSNFAGWAALFATGGSAYLSDGETMTATPFVKGQRVSKARGVRRS